MTAHASPESTRIDARVTVVIVNFNAGERLRICLEALEQTMAADSRWNVIVVDNASTDGSIERLREGMALQPVSIVRNQRNVGFGAAINQAAHMTAAPLLWVLNPDCVVLPGAFEALAATLQTHPDCAIAAPQLLNADGSIQESARGAPTAWTGLFGRHGLLTRLFPRSAIARRNLRARDLVATAADSAAVDWVMGASMLVRHDRFDLVGGFDERYFLYWEDADLCRRLEDQGFTTRYVPRARVLHEGGASAATMSRVATREFHRSAYLYYTTHVVRSPWHPARGFAKAALAIRAWWRGR